MSQALEYILSLKDQFSAQFKTAASNANEAGGRILAAGDLIARGVSAIGPVASSAFGLLKGDYDQLGNMLGMLPGPIGQVGGAIGSALGGAMKETVDYTEAMRKASAATGASVGFMSQFTEAADDQFISQETVTRSLEKLSKGLGGAMDMEGGFNASGKGTAQVLEDMGIKATDATGKVLPLESLIPQIADKFQQMGPGAKAAALAVQLFGKSGQEMLPMLLKGSKAMEDSMKAAKDMGLAIDDKAVIAVTNLKQQQDALGDSFTASGRQLSIALIPALAELTRTLNGIDWKGIGSTVDYLFHGWDSYATRIDRVNNNLASGAAIMAGAAVKANALGTASGDAASLMDKFGKSVHTSSDAFLQYSDMSRESAKAIAENSLATQDNAQKQADLRDRTNEVISAIGGETKVMTEAQETQVIMELATGKLSMAQFETETATKAVMQALKDGKLSQVDAVRIMKDLAAGTITAEQAMGKAGHSADNLKGQMIYTKQAVAAVARDLDGYAGAVNDLPVNKTSMVTIDASKGPYWDQYFGQAGIYNSVADTTATKYIAGGISKPWFEVYGAGGTYNSVGDSKATKVALGVVDGTLTSTKSFYDSLANGTVKASLTMQVDVTYSGVYTCFVAGTTVSTPEGNRAIESLQIGDAVFAYDTEANEVVVSTVTETFAHDSQPLMRITLADGMVIVCTENHPFFHPATGQYKEAGVLSTGENLLHQDGTLLTIIDITHCDYQAPVYNIHVDRYCNYFVGVLVHNKYAPTPRGPSQGGNGMQTGTGTGGSTGGLSFSNVISGGVNDQRVARMVNQAQARATRQALLRAGIGG